MKKTLATFVLLLCSIAANAASTIKIIFPMTPAAQAAIRGLGSDAVLQSWTESRAAELTSAFQNSGIALAAESVGWVPIDTNYSITSSDIILAMNDVQICLERDARGADIVVVITNAGGAAGAVIESSIGTSNPAEALAMVEYVPAQSNLSVAHEVGHLLGSRHQWAVDSSMTPQYYGHGYLSNETNPNGEAGHAVTSCFHTILAYSQPCSNGETSYRIANFSNPSVVYHYLGANLWFAPFATGKRASPHFADEASFMGAAGALMANFRNTKIAGIPLAKLIPATQFMLD